LFRHPDVEEFISTRHDVAEAAMDISPASQARILAAKLRAQFEQLFADQSKPVGERMVDQANAASATATYNSLKELSGGLSLDVRALSPDVLEAMKLAVATQVSLIKSIPSQYFTKVEGAVYRSMTGGNGLQDLHEFFVKQYGEESRRAKNIALDQTRKAYNNLNKERMKKHGVGKFEWLHSGGGLHPRPLHQSYNGRVFSFGNLPIIDEATGERGIPGQAINCGCTMVPVIEFEQGEAIK
jgi:SPP1 gp7 family putative phage head morphogenesis protein